ncbi:MAG: hypothetical protein V3S82_10390 [Dehalococcoidia bacterium]
MINLLLRTAGITSLAGMIRKDVSRFRKDIKVKLRKAGNVVRKRERSLLKSGFGPSLRRIERTSKSGRKRKSSKLLSHHKVIVRPAKGGLKKTGQQWEVFVGPTPGGQAFYGKFFETGTVRRQSRYGNRGAIRARPWMGPALEQELSNVEAILGETFTKLRIVGS